LSGRGGVLKNDAREARGFCCGAGRAKLKFKKKISKKKGKKKREGSKKVTQNSRPGVWRKEERQVLPRKKNRLEWIERKKKGLALLMCKGDLERGQKKKGIGISRGKGVSRISQRKKVPVKKRGKSDGGEGEEKNELV